jgi:hypothetical protein
MLAVLPSLSADAVQSVRDYNIRATNVKVRGFGAVSSDRSGPLGSLVAAFVPDLRKRETRLNMAVLVKF